MTPEQQFFLTLLRDHLHGRKTSPPQDVLDWKGLLRLASSHQMSPIFFHQCGKWLAGYSPETFQRLLEYHTAHLLHRAELERSFQRLETKLNEENIPYFVMKGGEIAQFYPVPVLRSSSDVDLLVHTEHRQRVYDILTAEGFEGTAFDNHEWGFSKGDTHFEVHNHLIFDDGPNTKESVAFCDRCWEYAEPLNGSSRYWLDWSFHFVYLLLHMRKHIIFEGIGIRQFFDLAILAKELREVVDWNWVRNTLDELNLTQFGAACLTLCEKWFDVTNPFGENTMTDAFFEQTTDTVMKNGVFGFHNEENEVSHLTRTLSVGKLPYPLKIICLVLSNIFPSYEGMCDVPYYSFLKGRPWLLPAAWVYRWGYVIRHKFKHGMTVLTEPVGKRKQVETRAKALNDWGL